MVEVLLAQNESAPPLTVGLQPFAQAMTDARGNLAISAFAAPPVDPCMTPDMQRPGIDPTLFVAQTADGSARAAMPFTYYPSPIIIFGADPFGAANAAIALTGANWEPSEKVTITPAIQPWPASGTPDWDTNAFQRLSGQAITVTAARDGSFEILMHLPNAAAETQVIFIASAIGPLYGPVSFTSSVYNIIPSAPDTLSLSATSAAAGDSVMLTGANWPANQDIQILYCWNWSTKYGCVSESDIGSLLATTRADKTGHLHVRVQIPSNAPRGPGIIQVAPVSTPFDPAVYTRSATFAVLPTFAESHPRLEMIIQAAPYIGGGFALVVGAGVGLGFWQRRRRSLSRGANAV
jgi:hypothetical protein